MTPYEILCDTNRRLIEFQPIPDGEKQAIVLSLLGAASPPETVRRFLAGVKATEQDRSLYPLFYIPSYNAGKKQRLVTGQMPKTHMLSANHYELEILRLLALWSPADERVRRMVEATLQRLDATCFAHFCPEGDCVGAGVAALRFLSAVRPADDPWIEQVLQPAGEIFKSIKGQAATAGNLPRFYFCLALAEIHSDLSRQILRESAGLLLDLFHRGWLTGPAENDTYNPLLKAVIRYTLAGLPEFECLRDARIYISDKDGRVYGEETGDKGSGDRG